MPSGRSVNCRSRSAATLLWLIATVSPAFTFGGVTATTAVALHSNDAWIMNGTGSCCVTPESPWLQPLGGYIDLVVNRFIAGTLAPRTSARTTASTAPPVC